MTYKITIPGRYSSLNQFIAANRVRVRNWSKANAMKQEDQETIIPYIKKAIKTKIQNTVYIHYTFVEESHKRDLDNVSGYFLKIFQDSLVKSEVLENDGWKWIKGFDVTFDVDKENPRIEVVITEVKESK